MPSILRPSFSIVQHSHDAFPTTYEMPWDQLAERLAQHRVGDKDGTAIICGTFSGTRSSKTLLERWLIALDVEQNKTSQRVPPDPESVAHYLMAKGLAGVIWTTWSHTPELPRYRIVMPLSEQLRPALIGKRIDRLLSSTVAANLRLNGVVDAGKFGAASLMFLARHAEGRPFWSRVVDGDPINAKELYSVAYIINEKDAMSVAQRAALRQTLEFSPQVRAKIDRYNALNELTDLLGRYGYRRQGERWKSPLQHPSSQAATAIFPDGQMFCTFSQSDIDAGIGTKRDDCAFGDAFALALHWEHKGNFRAALESIELPEGWDHERVKER